MQASSKQERSFPFRHAAHILQNRKDLNMKCGSSKGARAGATCGRTCDWKSPFWEIMEACNTHHLCVCRVNKKAAFKKKKKKKIKENSRHWVKCVNNTPALTSFHGTVRISIKMISCIKLLDNMRKYSYTGVCVCVCELKINEGKIPLFHMQIR